jgi:hypothetical protein
MSLIHKDDYMILKSVLRKEDFSICHKVFKKMTFQEFLEAENLELTYEGTQAKLRHLITVVKPWNCVKDLIESFITSTGIDLSNSSPCFHVWKGYCTVGCSLCYALKNSSLKYDFTIGRGWKHRSKFQRLHSKLIANISHFIEDNIAQMVEEYYQDKPFASAAPSCAPFEPPVVEEPEAVSDVPVICRQTSLKRKAEPVTVRFSPTTELISGEPTPTEEEINNFVGVAKERTSRKRRRSPEPDHVVKIDEPSYHPISPPHQSQSILETGDSPDYRPDHLIGDVIVDDPEDVIVSADTFLMQLS